MRSLSTSPAPAVRAEPVDRPNLRRSPSQPPWVKLWNLTFNNVKFGISTMVLIALYIAIGSGFSSIRAWFEVSDLAFFNAWPMRVLAGMLVLNLLTVSMNRIPFTPPRYGVWSVHIGIIVLVYGMVYYFMHKTEGMTLVRIGESVDYYYDASERALYVKAGRRKAEPIALPDLPRFDTYSPEKGNAGYLNRSGLQNLAPSLTDYDPETRSGVSTPLHKAVGADGDEPLTLSIVAYYPYAVVTSSYFAPGDTGYPADAIESTRTGLRLKLRDPVNGETALRWLVADDEGQHEERVGTIRFRHLHRSDELTGDQLLQAAAGAHAINWTVGEATGSIAIEPGQRLPLGETGYELEWSAFLPQFPMFGGGEPVDTLELLVHPPAESPHGKTFRRYLLDGLPTQTDFVLDVEGAGPKGQRQEKPVDTQIKLEYAFSDALNLLPRGEETERQTILTRPDVPGFWRLVTSQAAPALLEKMDDGHVALEVNGQVVDPQTHQPQAYTLELDIERVDDVAKRTSVAEVPPNQRDSQTAQVGSEQVVMVKAQRGDWSRTIPVPYTQWPDQAPWRLGHLEVPGFEEPVQLQLANTRRLIGTWATPSVEVTLDRFELVPYAGDFTSQSTMRDFQSHLTLVNRGAGTTTEETAFLNNPVYFDVPYQGLLGKIWPSQSWLLYQNQWDPEGQQFTVLGVGNRPGITVMTVGCVMIVLGLLWAFYVKPILIRRNKEKALRAHAARTAA